jgi:hypothetical protein
MLSHCNHRRRHTKLVRTHHNIIFCVHWPSCYQIISNHSFYRTLITLPARKTAKLWLTCMLAVSYIVECLYRLQQAFPEFNLSSISGNTNFIMWRLSRIFWKLLQIQEICYMKCWYLLWYDSVKCGGSLPTFRMLMMEGRERSLMWWLYSLEDGRHPSHCLEQQFNFLRFLSTVRLYFIFLMSHE